MGTKPLLSLRFVLAAVLALLVALWMRRCIEPPLRRPVVLSPDPPLREVQPPKGFVRTPIGEPPPMAIPPDLPPEELESRLDALTKLPRPEVPAPGGQIIDVTEQDDTDP